MNSEKTGLINCGVKAGMTILVLLSLFGCASSVQMVNGAKFDDSAMTCDVTIYDTLKIAERNGPIEELCIITDDLGVQPIGYAINANKAKICKCGAKHAYVQSSSGSVFTQVLVTLVGFKYLEQSATKPAITAEK